MLVVDDEDDLRDVVCTLLQRAGLRTTSARDGQQALKALYDERPDLVVLDAAMPVLDGWQTLERIRHLSDVPVMMLTARDGELEKVRGLKAGADDYVTKPFGRQELVARVEALLRRAGDREDAMVVYDDGLVRIDFADARVFVEGKEVGAHPVGVQAAGHLRAPSQPGPQPRPAARAGVGAGARRGPPTRSRSTSATCAASSPRRPTARRSKPCAASATAIAPRAERRRSM